MKTLKESLRRNARLALMSAAAFAAGIPAGAVAYPLISDQVPSLMQAAFGGIMTDSQAQTILRVFLRNASASLIIMAAGVTVILPVAILALNGFFVGLVASFAVDRGLGAGTLLMGVTPHGVVELPALFIASAAGMRIGWEALTRKGSRARSAAQAAAEAAKIYVFAVLPLLAVAAVVEILVSRNLIR
jgi:stage II sporulation protein M